MGVLINDAVGMIVGKCMKPYTWWVVRMSIKWCNAGGVRLRVPVCVAACPVS